MRIVVLAVVVLALAAPAESVVLCAKQRRDGTFSSTVRIREECRSREVELDPAALGFQGPPVPSMVVKDSTGAIVGFPDGSNRAILELDGQAVRIPLTDAGFWETGAPELYFETTDCTGTAYISDNSFDWYFSSIPPIGWVEGSLAYYPASGFTTKTTRSRIIDTGSGPHCDSPFGPDTKPYREVVSFDLTTLGFVPPFCVEVTLP